MILGLSQKCFWIALSNHCMSRKCILGFENGKNSAIPTSRKNVGYGYQFWVYEINGEKMITMTGHGGFFNILSQNKNKVLSIFSVDEAYKAGNLFGDLESVVGEVFK